MDESVFIRKCISGEKRVWGEFVDKYARLIYSYIRRTLALKGIQDAGGDFTDEIFQEVFLALIRDNRRKLRSYQGRNGCSFTTWLRQVSINMTIDHVRKRRFRQSKIPLVGDSAQEKIIECPGGQSPSSEAIAEEKRRHLAECIAKMGTEDKFFMELHIRQGLRLEEMQRVLRFSRGMLDMRKRRIIAQLRECFRNQGYEFLTGGK